MVVYVVITRFDAPDFFVVTLVNGIVAFHATLKQWHFEKGEAPRARRGRRQGQKKVL